MTNQLPSHVQGWKIPAGQGQPELAVTRGGWIGPMYDVGVLKPDVSQGFDLKTANAWLVEGDEMRGMAFMSVETTSEDSDLRVRSAAALLHICLTAETAADGFMPPRGVFYVPKSTLAKTSWDTLTELRRNGFEQLYHGGTMVGHPDDIRSLVGHHLPDLATIQPIPQAPPAS